MSVSEWFRFLKWKRSPSFTDIHELPDDEFLDQYYNSDPELIGIMQELKEELQVQYPMHAIRIQAPPGWGKTSFLSYIARTVNKEDMQRYITIIKCDDLASINSLDSNLIEERSYQALREFFSQCCINPAYYQATVNNKDIDKREKIRRLIERLRKHPKDFSKKLAIVLDGVDTIPEQFICTTALEMFNLFSSSEIIKWLAIRNTTFEAYSDDIQNKLSSFFPLKHEFPRVSLLQIIKKRIKFVNGDNALNPYSPKLCLHVQSLTENDHRKGLAALKDIIIQAKADSIEGVTEEYLQRLFEQAAITSLIRQGHVPNIFQAYGGINTQFPLAKEVLELAYCHQHYDDVFKELIEESVTEKTSYVVAKSLMVAGISPEEIGTALEYLAKLRLLDVNPNKSISLSSRGLAFKAYLNNRYYIDECWNRLETQKENKIFWRIAKMESHFREKLMKLYFRDDLKIEELENQEGTEKD
jgi:Cdc6-like AAA superfamily ATPase